MGQAALHTLCKAIVGFLELGFQLLVKGGDGAFMQVLELTHKQHVELDVEFGQHLFALLLINTLVITRGVFVKGAKRLLSHIRHERA
jgi:hypothetical protein